MIKTKMHLGLGSSLLGLTIVLAVPAQAQTATADMVDEQGGSLEEIIVTAQKRAENLQDVPISVSALSGAQLTSSGVSLQSSMPQVTPNLQVNVNSEFATPFVRGIGTRYANVGLDPSVAIYLDDQYYPRANSGLFSFSDLSRIEVLKGPQGTLYGRNTLGGAIRILTNDPVFEPEFKFSGGYGTYNRVQLDGTANIQLTNTLAIRASGGFDKMDGYVHNVDPNKPALGDRNQRQALAKLLWKPTDALTVKLTGHYARRHDFEGMLFLNAENSGPNQVGIAMGGTPRRGFYSVSTDLEDNNGAKALNVNKGAVARIDYDFGPATFSTITGVLDSRSRIVGDIDGTDLPLQHVAAAQTFTKDFTQEAQLVSNGSGPLKYQVGVFYLHEKGRYFLCATGSLVGVPTGVGVCGDGFVNVRSIAPYGQASYEFNDQIELTVGARYTSEKKTLLSNTLDVVAVDNNVLPQSILSSTLVDPGQSVKYNRFTPKVTLSFRPNSEVLLFGNWGKGFKSGGFNLPAFGAVDKVLPETLNAFEVGAKTQFGAVRWNTSLFYYKQKDIQVQIRDPLIGVVRVTNAASAKLYGLESELDWAVSRELTVGGNIGLLHARFGSYPDGVQAVPAATSAACLAGTGPCIGYINVGNVDFRGHRVPFAPTLTGSVHGSYEVDLGASGTVTFNTNVSYTSKFTYDPQGYPVEPAHEILNANISWRSEANNLWATIYGTNLTARKYSTDKAITNIGGSYTPGRPIEAGVRVGVSW